MPTTQADDFVSSIAFTSTHSLVFDVPMFLLTLDRTVARVPAAMIHCLFLAVVTLQQQKQGHHHNGDQAARRRYMMCSICDRRFTTPLFWVRWDRDELIR